MEFSFKPGVVVLSRRDWKDLMRQARQAEVEEHRRQRRLLLAERLKARRAALAAAQA